MRARDNPFRTDRILQVRYRLEQTTWPELLERLARMQYRAAIVGPHGSGKTTLLEDLEARLREKNFGVRFLRLDTEHPAWAPRFLRGLFAGVTRRDVILFDGAEQMDFFSWQRFRWRARAAGGLIITTHRPGRLPTLIECRTSPRLLAGIAAELLEVNGTAIAPQMEALFHRHRGNLRDALRECYDAAGRPSHGRPGCGTP